MKVIHLVGLLLIYVFSATAQDDSLIEVCQKERKKADNLVDKIERRNPQKTEVKECNLIDYIGGCKITSIEKQKLRNFVKVSVTPHLINEGLAAENINFYFINESLVQVKVNYDNKGMFYKVYYFHNNYCCFIRVGGGLRTSIDDDGQEYKVVAEKLLKNKELFNN